MDLLEDYKKESDGRKLQEKNSKWLNDDYVKFIRYSESYIQKNEEGILAFITNHSYIDNPTFRGMRYHLLSTFDKIYIIDLHGNSKKKEVCPDGSKDENVFDIMQGVAIIIGIKKKTKSKKLAELFIYDLYGKRNFKYEFLSENSLKSLDFKQIKYSEPDFYFFNKNLDLEDEYKKNIYIKDFFHLNCVGIATSRDGLVIDDNKEKLESKLQEFFDNDKSYIQNIMKVKENSSFKIDKIKEISILNFSFIKPFAYRTFDIRYIYYNNSFIERSRENVMKHFINDNIGLITNRQCQTENYQHTFITKVMNDLHITETANANPYTFPLYLYNDENSLTNERTPNLNLEIIKEIEEKLGLKFVNEKIEDSTTFAPIDILDYIYAVLHSPNYREKYKEFLKIDFPRVPYPSISNFWQLVSLGGKLRQIHLLEDASLDNRIIDIKGEAELKITNKLAKKDTVIENDIVTLNLNSEISIINIPLVAWEFYIGGYQPAQKWLKDRVGRTLSRADLKHYNRIINALCKTDEIMKEIDNVLEV
ncbi:MAG: type ISP restriction/modification enzyme [Aliarcobacter sp.]|nr:type ISP restriction/modification enzyme [Aliarcobacter sp.]